MADEEGIRARLSAILEGDSDPKLEAELPFATMMITLMAASGITPYESFKRMRNVDILKKFKVEGEEIVRLVEVLGQDPLTAMERRAEATISRQYADFLEGYISSVKSGGSIINYLVSKLRNIFEEHAAKAQNAIERLEALVEAYMVMLIVIFCIYILSSVTSPTTGMIGGELPDITAIVYPLMLVIIPIFSLFFMYLANTARPGTLRGMHEPYYIAIGPIALFAIFFAATQLLPQFAFINEFYETPLILSAGLILTSIPSAISYNRIARRNFSAENAMPSLLRDVTEARRTGLSPEKAIVHAAGRRGYGPFTADLKRIINQIEWGVSLRKIYEDLASWIKSWTVVVNFFILVETIEIGGGNAETLSLLAEYSEKTQTVNKSQKDMLMPYIILPFVWTILMVFTVTFTTQTLNSIPSMALGAFGSPGMVGGVTESSGLLEASIMFHSWLSGFFIGKVSEGNFASGFKYAALLTLTAYLTLIGSRVLVTTLVGGLL
ncbi:MAG TPA: type II secretion system F family protein [Patescibacteria group bacterium]|nr:type II secretion system F family protein [Patescibacteria group bacterium]